MLLHPFLCTSTSLTHHHTFFYTCTPCTDAQSYQAQLVCHLYIGKNTCKITIKSTKKLPPKTTKHPQAMPKRLTTGHPCQAHLLEIWLPCFRIGVPLILPEKSSEYVQIADIAIFRSIVLPIAGYAPPSPRTKVNHCYIWPILDTSLIVYSYQHIMCPLIV